MESGFSIASENLPSFDRPALGPGLPFGDQLGLQWTGVWAQAVTHAVAAAEYAERGVPRTGRAGFGASEDGM